MKVSVIVPVYNVERYLERCILSIIHQTYQEIEVLLIDDGSKDKSGEICEQFAEIDQRIHVIHKENGGLSSARNKGIEIATGEYLAFIDSDDCIHADFIQFLLSKMVENDCDLGECRYSTFTEEIPDKMVIQDDFQVLNSEESAMRIYSNDYVQAIITCNKLFNKELFQNVRFPEGRVHEDEATIYKLLYESKKSLITHNEMYYYYIRSGSITMSEFSEKRFDYLKALDERVVYFKERNDALYKQSLKRAFYDSKTLLYEARRANYKNANKIIEVKKCIQDYYTECLKTQYSFKTKGLIILFYSFPFLYDLYVKLKPKEEK